MLLRWTSALRGKKAQLKKRLERNVVGRDDIYVVAINSYMLSWFPVEDVGITGLPFAVEAVFPIGPFTISFERTKDGPRAGAAEHAFRSSIVKPATDAPVPTDNFFDREYNGISALIGCSRNHMLDGDPYLIVVHNPLARNRLPDGLLGAKVEYVAKMDEEHLTITRNYIR
jgi:type I restriction enzyme S subunit